MNNMNIEVYFNNGERVLKNQCTNVTVNGHYLCIKDTQGNEHYYNHDTINHFHLIKKE